MNKHIREITSAALITALMLGAAAGCSEDLGPETLPSTSETTEETVETSEEPTEETTETSEETTIGPKSTAIRSERPVDVNGQLKIGDGSILNKEGEQVQLRGISSCNIIECQDFFTDDVISTLGYDWGCDVVRLSFPGDVNDDPEYAKKEEGFFNSICQMTDALIEQGLYIVIDWHIKECGDPMQYKDFAVDFFSRISAIYGDKENIIYEICNEPSGKHFDDESKDVDWTRIRKYAKAVTAAIRENDPDNLIICGTPNGCKDIDLVSESPVKGDNICYAVHFNAGADGQELRDKCDKAIEDGICIIASEWSTTDGTDESDLFLTEASGWLDYLDGKNISWIYSSIGGDGMKKSDALSPYTELFTPEEKKDGHWPDDFISDSGLFIKARLASGT